MSSSRDAFVARRGVPLPGLRIRGAAYLQRKEDERVSLRDGANQQGGDRQRPPAGTPLPPRLEGNDANGGAAGDGHSAAPTYRCPMAARG